MRIPSQTQHGMTFVEILVALTIIGVITVAVAAIFQIHLHMAMKQEETTLMQQELSAATSQIAEELRMCGYSPTGAPGFGFRHMPTTGAPDYGRATNETSVYCTLDFKGDGTVDESGSGSLSDHSGFRLDVLNSGEPKTEPDHVLRKYDTGAVHWQPLYTNIGDLRFTYFDARGEVISDPSARTDEIRMVEFKITAIPSPTRNGLGIGNRTMSTRVWCRNSGL